MSLADDPRYPPEADVPDNGQDQQDATSLTPARANGPSPWHGRTARDAQGNRIMWQEPINGRGGRFVRMSEGTSATPSARATLQAERNRLRFFDQAAALSDQFNDLNSRTTTGGWRQRSLDRELSAQADPVHSGDLWHGLNFPVALYQLNNQDEVARLERMRSMQADAVRAAIAASPGSATTANSGVEQQMIAATFPNINYLGTVNSERTANMQVNRDLQRQRVATMEAWLQQNPDLSGFEDYWTQREQPLRAALLNQYRQHYRVSPAIADSGGNYDPNAPQQQYREGGIYRDANGQRARYQHGQFVPVQ